MATVVEIEELNARLLSEKARVREDGLKTLHAYLDAPGSSSFCRLLDHQTLAHAHHHKIPSSTWQGVLKALCSCIEKEVATSKKRGPKQTMSKMLRTFVQKAEDVNRCGKCMFLLRAVKPLFRHILTVISEAPSFISDYSHILRQLLTVTEYRLHMSKKVYSSFVNFFLEKVKIFAHGNIEEPLTAREECFRMVHFLLQNPPGDYPEQLRKEVAGGLCEIFSQREDRVAKDDRVAKKLLAALNTFLLNDGPNLGYLAVKMHSSMADFIIRTWLLKTRDRELKDALVLYARIQLRLRTIVYHEEGKFIMQLFELIEKEFEQSGTSSGMHRFDGGRDERVGPVPRSLLSFLELAASVCYEVGVTMSSKISVHGKRQKRGNIFSLIKDQILEGKWLWGGTCCLIIRRYYVGIPKPTLIDWFQGLSRNLERFLAEGVNTHGFESCLWTLRCLKELCAVWSYIVDKKLGSQFPLFVDEHGHIWQLVWSSVLHWLPFFSTIQIMVDEAFRLLGYILTQSLLPVYAVPRDFWNITFFSEVPAGSTLFFVAAYFSTPCDQIAVSEDVKLRRKLLEWSLLFLDCQDKLHSRFSVGSGNPLMLCCAAILALTIGFVPFSTSIKQYFSENMLPYPALVELLPDWAELEEQYKAQENELNALNCAESSLAAAVQEEGQKVCGGTALKGSPLPFSISNTLLKELADCLLQKVSTLLEDSQPQSLNRSLDMCCIMLTCIDTITHMMQRREDQLHDWFYKGIIWQGVSDIIEHCILIVKKVTDICHERNLEASTLSWDQNICQIVSPAVATALMEFLSCSGCCMAVTSGKSSHMVGKNKEFVDLLEDLLLCFTETFRNASDLLKGDTKDGGDIGSAVRGLPCIHLKGLPNSVDNARIVDFELDVKEDVIASDTASAGERADAGVHGGTEESRMNTPYDFWKLSYIRIIVLFARHIPDKTCDVLVDLLVSNSVNELQVRWELILHLSRSLKVTSEKHVEFLASEICNMFESGQEQEYIRHRALAAIAALLGSVLDSEDTICSSTYDGRGNRVSLQWKLSERVLLQLSSVVSNITKNGLLLWSSRIILAQIVISFVMLDPNIAQELLDTFLVLLHDPDYRVRLAVSNKVGVLFQTWTGHDELLQDVCSNFGFKMVMATRSHVENASETISVSKDIYTLVETAVVTLGEIAAISDKVEDEVVFIICGLALAYSDLRLLICIVMDRLARRLQYQNRWKYLAYHLGAVVTRWIKVGLAIPGLVEILELLVFKPETLNFLQHCCSLLLPPLFLYEREDDLLWLAKVSSQPVSTLVKQHFGSIFAALLPMHCGDNEPEKAKAVAILQGSLSAAAQMSDDERDDLIKKHMVSIVNAILQSGSAAEQPQFPFFPKAAVVCSIKTVVDGFLESDGRLNGGGVIDKLQIFRPDRVFMFLLQLHFQMESACHPRHKSHILARMECLLNVIQNRIEVPTTFRYVIHILLLSIEMEELQHECCRILTNILDMLNTLSPERSSEVIGDQLQRIVSKLVACCINLYKERSRDGDSSYAALVSLLDRLIVGADHSLYKYIEELAPFPDLPCFKSLRLFHLKLCAGRTYADSFVKFVRKASDMPYLLRAKSLQDLHKQLENISYVENLAEDRGRTDWECNYEVISAVWDLVRICCESNAHDMDHMAGDFIAKVGIGDPHGVVFHLPGRNGPEAFSLFSSDRGPTRVSIDPELGVEDTFVKVILLQIWTYLVADAVHVIELALQTLKGLLSTEKGQRVLKTLDAKQRVYLELYSRGVNQTIVQNLVNEAVSESSQKSRPLEDDSLWQISGKSYDTWICTLVYSLIHYSEDTVLRLCQGLVNSKSSLAEVVLPHVLGNIAATGGSNSNICKLLSAQIEKHVFCEENVNTRSMQLFLEAVNELRTCYVLAIMRAGIESGKKKEILKGGKVGSNADGSRGEELATDSKTSNSITSGTPGRQSKMQASEGPSTWQKVYWLHVDYLKTARVAQLCGAFLSSVLYAEHWCEEKFGVLTLGEPDFSNNEELPVHVELLLNICTKINEPDGIYGVVCSHKLISQLLTYEHEGNWSRAVDCYDLLLHSKQPLSDCTSKMNIGSIASRSLQQQKLCPEWKYNKGLMKSLQQTGCSHVLEVYCDGLVSQKSSIQQDAEFQELQYEAAWRAGKWDFYPSFSENTSQFFCVDKTKGRTHFHASLHSCLRSLHEGDIDLFSSKLKQAKQELVNCIAYTNLESTQNIHPAIVKLQILNCISKAWDMRWRQSTCLNDIGEQQKTKLSGPHIPSDQQVKYLDADWKLKLQQMQSDYDLLEPYVSFQKVLFEVLECRDHVTQHLLEFARLARKAGRFNQAIAAIHELKLTCNEITKGNSGLSQQKKLLPSKIFTDGRIEEAKTLWAQGQHEMAVNLAKYIIQHYDNQGDSAKVLCLTGKWLADSRSGSSRVILEQYLRKAVELSETRNSKSRDRICRTHYHLAHYADSLYRSYEERLNSSEWQAALRLRQHKARELNELVKRLKSAVQGDKRDYTMKVLELEKQLKMDNEEAQCLEDDRDSFLSIALDSYRCCLATGSKYDVRVVFRVTSLWFNLSTRAKVVEAMLQTVKQVKSFKFVPLVYQIASRLGGSKDSARPGSFQCALTYLVKKMAVEHPYHTVYQLLALSNGHRVKDKQRNKSAFVIDMEKKQAAENLLNALLANHGSLIQQMVQMVEIYIRLAELEVKREDTNKKLTLPRDVRGIRQLDLVPVITAQLPVDPGCNYPLGSFPYFKGLSDRIVVMNGINAPKLVECLGSDGRKYRQLAKSGNDDLRQDAVMEQLFSLVNTLLQHNPDSRKRRLGIRTYKVIPFTPSAGVLEWVDGTIPLGEYLLGSNRTGGAHSRYGHGDWTFPMCRDHMITEKDKRKAFEKVSENFRPVMHNFFLEKFIQPAEWFEKRLAYTRSVAASSMVGYIVGLGDRHSMNILIDQASAEVVHIDLGVAFEQGLMLKTPERVPFRLTRDIVDGMGVTGVEGVFRRCCEETLRVMHTNKEALLTIIEVFIHDPLYKWALSPLKALQRQKETNELGDEADGNNDEASDMESPGELLEGNKDAARALLRVKQKLDGYEGGDMRSIQGQVQQLIQDAQDPERLCQLYPGWGAWL